MNKIPIIAIVGPTASGKTELSIKIAEKFNCEIISADSMQIYKEFSILTAKPSLNQLNKIKHYMIDIVSAKKNFSVANYVKIAKICAIDIVKKNKTPLIVGGTGLYIDSFLNDIEFEGDKKDYSKVRKKLYERYNNGENLYNELIGIDPQSAANIHKNDIKRTVRAIEFYYCFGYPISLQVERSKAKEPPYNPIIIGLNFRNRQVLYDRINKRVDYMATNGLVSEVESVLGSGISKTAAASIGYKEMIPFLKGECGLEDAIENVKKETRRYAKRQITWFKKNKKISWLYIDDYSSFLDMISSASQIVKRGFYNSEV